MKKLLNRYSQELNDEVIKKDAEKAAKRSELELLLEIAEKRLEQNKQKNLEQTSIIN